MKKFLVLVANGSEEIETVIIVDVLRRAGWEVTLTSIHESTTLTCSRQVRLVADTTLTAVADPLAFDALILPGGGPGTQAFKDEPAVASLCKRMHEAGKWIGAICAAPTVLDSAGLLNGRAATCFPSRQSEMKTARLSSERVVVDGHIITSQGPGTTFDFALMFVEKLGSPPQAAELKKALVLGS